MTNEAIHVEIKGLGEMLSRLRALEDAGANAQDAMHLIGAWMLEVVRDAFLNEEAPSTGEAWAPLAKKTLESRYLGRLRSTYSSGAPLRRVGSMFNSITVLDTSARSVAIGTTLPHAYYHNSNQVSEKRTFPKREFIGFPPDAQDQVTEILSAYLGDAIA